jgi:MFS transporter, Spinster family, sphingosine-1-phosphate transporter
MSDVAPIANAGGERRPGRYPAYVFWIMFIISFLNYLDRNVLSGAANTVAKELGFGADGIGFIASAFLVVYTLGTVPLGIWADRTKRKNVVAASVAAWSLITAFTALATSFATLFISRMALGIGEAGYFPAGTALMSDYYSRSKRSRIMSLWSVGQLFGILVGFVIGGELAGLFPGSWRLAFVFTGIPGLILAFLAWRLREPRRNEADEEELALQDRFLPVEEIIEEEQTAHAVVVTPDVFKQFGSLLRIKTMVVLIVMQVFAYFVLGVNLVFLPTYLQQKDIFNFSPGQAGLFSGAVIVLAGMIGTVLGGYMADLLNRRFPGARILVCGIGFLLSAPAFAIAILVHSLGIFTLFFIITAILLTVYTGPSTAATQDVVPSALRASAVAITLLIAHLLGDAFSPSVVGILVKAIDPTHGLHFQNGVAGQDFSIALFVTCTPALIIAGLVGIFGSGWMKGDIAAAELADKRVREQRAG